MVRRSGVLPRPPTSFVGRESELAKARRPAGGARLLTLTGPGGCGKTRLAIELAVGRWRTSSHGVHFVSLAAVRDPALVPVSIARGIGLQDARGHTAAGTPQRLPGRAGRPADPGQHRAGARRTRVRRRPARRHRRPRILVTSRSPLHLSWEQEFPVPPLRVRQRGPAVSAASVAGCESVQLFAVRAAASVPGFTVTGENARRHRGNRATPRRAAAGDRAGGGAGEAAAAGGDPGAAGGLAGLLVSGSRDVPDRQRTLRATIAWSHDLLSEAAGRLLAVCSVFRGGIELDTSRRLRRGARSRRAGARRLGTGRPQPAAAGEPQPRPRRVTRCWRPSASSGRATRASDGADAVRAAHASVFWDLARASPARRPPRTRPASTSSSSSTTISVRRWTGTVRRIQRGRCAWLTGLPGSGPFAGTSSRAGGGWASCSGGSRTTTRNGWTRSAARRGSRPTRETVPRPSACLTRASNAPAPHMTLSERPPACTTGGAPN